MLINAFWSILTGGVSAQMYVLHKKIPRQVYTVLFRHALALVFFSHGGTFLNELVIRNPVMIHIMDQGREKNTKLSQRI